ncbi:unnamed protein product, partial [Urochloa humidicola]
LVALVVPLDDFSLPSPHDPSPPRRAESSSNSNQAHQIEPSPGATKSRGPGDPGGSRSSGEVSPGAEGAGAGGGEVVGVGGGGWGVCDDNPVQAGGAAPRLPDPIPAQARHYRSYLMGLALLLPDNIVVHDTILQALLA